MPTDQRPPAAADLAAETDADLLLFMSMAAEDGRCAQAAWEEFYRRHVEYLSVVCARAYGSLLGGEAGVADLVADVFKRAFEHAGTFNPEGITDPQRLRLRARAWLGRIAQRLAQDVLRGRKKLPVRLLDAEQWQQVAAEEPDAPQAADAELALVCEALQSLSEREQLVVRLTFQWYRPGAEHQRLSNEVCADLASQLQTTSENIRQIRHRALRKVEAYVKQNRPREADGRSTP